jgi:hypothetical protein
MRKLVFTATVVAAALVAIVSPAAASQPVTATGTFAILTDAFAPLRSADGNSFSTEIATLSYDGDLTGPATDTDTFVSYKDGSFSAHGTEICTSCTLGGRTGAFTATFSYKGSPTASGFRYVGHLTFTGGSGGLSGLHGQGTFQGNELGSSYSYNYAFAP